MTTTPFPNSTAALIAPSLTCIIIGWVYDVPSGNTPIVSPRWRAREVDLNRLGVVVDLLGEGEE